MQTRDPDLPGAHRQSPIKPGTLCLTLPDPRGKTFWAFAGRTVVAVRSDGICTCGEDIYVITATWLPEGYTWIHRSRLQPILPPGIDDQVEQSVGNPQLEVV